LCYVDATPAAGPNISKSTAPQHVSHITDRNLKHNRNLVR